MSAARRKRKLAFIFRQAKTLLKVFQDGSLRLAAQQHSENDRLDTIFGCLRSTAESLKVPSRVDLDQKRSLTYWEIRNTRKARCIILFRVIHF